MQFVPLHHADGPVPVQQIERHGDNRRIKRRCTSVLRMIPDNRVIPVVPGMSLWAHALYLKAPIECWYGIERCLIRGSAADDRRNRATVAARRELHELPPGRTEIRSKLIS